MRHFTIPVTNVIFCEDSKPQPMEGSTCINLMTCSLLSGIFCGSVPGDHTILSNVTEPVATGNVVEVICLAAMKFEDGQSTKTIVCMEDGDWSQKNPSCRGNTLHVQSRSSSYTILHVHPVECRPTKTQTKLSPVALHLLNETRMSSTTIAAFHTTFRGFLIRLLH